MSRVMRTTGVHHAVLGLALAGVAICSIVPATAGDLAAPMYRPAPYGGPDVYGRTYERDAPCRIVLQRGIDPYGRAFVHRVRMCDEGAVYPAPREMVGPPAYGYPPRRYYEPAPSGYEPYARPPAPIGQGY